LKALFAAEHSNPKSISGRNLHRQKSERTHKET
jgi:hypothetical protein